jgi:ferredoxin
MKKKTKNPKTNIVLPVILVSSALIVLFNFKDKIFPKTINKTNDDNSSNQNLNQTDEDIDTTTFQKLSVLTNRCRGCGKCTRIDPKHFELIGNKASIISTKNLDSEALKLAINNCPTQAIILE